MVNIFEILLIFEILDVKIQYNKEFGGVIMFDKRNQGYVEVIKTEFEEIRDDILQVFECTSLLGKEINPLLDDVDRRIARLDSHLDAIGVGWASKNTELKDMKDFVRKLNIMFNGLVKDIYDKTENAKLRGKKFVVPESRAKALKEKWSEFSKKWKEKTKQAEEKKEKREERKERFRNFILPLDFDSKEDAIVSARQEEYKNREVVVKLVAEHFGVKPENVRNWPDDKLVATADVILGKKASANDKKGQGPSFE